jgi:Carboxypeptidase regulatory-like domain
MKAQGSGAVLRLAAVGALCALATTAQSADAKVVRGEPLVHQMVVLRDGTTTLKTVRAKRATVRIERRTCVVPAATALSSLLQTRWRGELRLRDYGSCSRRPVDSAGLFVKAIHGEVNGGLDGWVYKVGRKLGTAGAADPAGSFGDGRLRSGQQVVWFYCVFFEASCQRSLEIAAPVSGRELSVTATGYDDPGDGVPVAGARVRAKGTSGAPVSATTDAQGHATLALPTAGRYVVRASKNGLIPAFPKRIDVD